MSKESELLFKIVETWGNAVLSIKERESWLKDYAKHVVISFTNWTTSAECDYSCSDEDQWNNIHNPHESITTEQLYEKYIQWSDNQFIEQQNKQ